MSKDKSHIHKLRRHTYKGGSQVYFCTNDCSYKVSVPMSLGKTVLCNRCEKPFKMNEYSIRLAKPHCNDCKVTKGEIPPEIKLNEPIGVVHDLRQRLNSLGAPKVDDSDL